MIAAMTPETRELTHRSPGITAIYNEIKSSQHNRILDLGSSSGASFTFFTQLSCKIHFESLDEFFTDPAHQCLSSRELIPLLDAYLFPFAEQQKFDVILAWDTFNYLNLDAIQWLMQRLTQHCRADTLLHTVKYVGTSIPSVPRQFQIINQYQLKVSQHAEMRPRANKAHDTARLLKHMPHYYMDNSYMSFEGMIPGLAEQVMRCVPRRSQLSHKQASGELSSADADGKKSVKIQARGIEQHQTYALPKICQHLAQLASPSVLDLGLKNRNNYDFLYSITETLYAENLHFSLERQEYLNSDGSLKPHILNYPTDLQFDVIFLWDILNFLTLQQTDDVFRKLRGHIHDNTIIHAILYSGGERPTHPQEINIVSETQFNISAKPKAVNTASLTSAALLKAMRHFTLSDTFFFREGMQRGVYEYIFKATTA